MKIVISNISAHILLSVLDDVSSEDTQTNDVVTGLADLIREELLVDDFETRIESTEPVLKPKKTLNSDWWEAETLPDDDEKDEFEEDKFKPRWSMSQGLNGSVDALPLQVELFKKPLELNLYFKKHLSLLLIENDDNDMVLLAQTDDGVEWVEEEISDICRNNNVLSIGFKNGDIEKFTVLSKDVKKMSKFFVNHVTYTVPS